jgi:hypothetical protein
VQETATKTTSAMEHRIQSLQDQLKAVSCNTKAKKSRATGHKKKTSEYPEEQWHPRCLQEISPQEIYSQEIYFQGICWCSRRKQQRFRVRQRKEEAKKMQCFIWWEEGQKSHKLAQIDQHATRETRKNFEFVPNITISIHLNAPHVLCKTLTGVYFTHFTNKQFHDLTMKKSIPAAAATVLSLGLKFIPVPKKSICPDDIIEALKWFDRDFYLNVHFADDDADSDNEEPIEKLQVNSKWMPDQPLLILLNILEILKEQLQGTSDLDAWNPTFQNPKPKFSSRFAATKISSLPTPTRT